MGHYCKNPGTGRTVGVISAPKRGDRHGVPEGFEYASPRNTRTPAVLRLVGLILLLAAICGAGGCIVTQLKATSNRPVDECMDVFVHAMIQQHTMDNICIFPFASPPVEKFTTLKQLRVDSFLTKILKSCIMSLWCKFCLFSRFPIQLPAPRCSGIADLFKGWSGKLQARKSHRQSFVPP